MIYAFLAVAIALGGAIFIFLAVLYLLGHLTKTWMSEPIDTPVGVLSMLFISYAITVVLSTLVLWFWVWP